MVPPIASSFTVSCLWANVWPRSGRRCLRGRRRRCVPFIFFAIPFGLTYQLIQSTSSPRPWSVSLLNNSLFQAMFRSHWTRHMKLLGIAKMRKPWDSTSCSPPFALFVSHSLQIHFSSSPGDCHATTCQVICRKWWAVQGEFAVIVVDLLGIANSDASRSLCSGGLVSPRESLWGRVCNASIILTLLVGRLEAAVLCCHCHCSWLISCMIPTWKCDDMTIKWMVHSFP